MKRIPPISRVTRTKEKMSKNQAKLRDSERWSGIWDKS